MKLMDTQTDHIREVLSILMESPLYFDMPLRERCTLVKDMLKRLY